MGLSAKRRCLWPLFPTPCSWSCASEEEERGWGGAEVALEAGSWIGLYRARCEMDVSQDVSKNICENVPYDISLSSVHTNYERVRSGSGVCLLIGPVLTINKKSNVKLSSRKMLCVEEGRIVLPNMWKIRITQQVTQRPADEQRRE